MNLWAYKLSAFSSAKSQNLCTSKISLCANPELIWVFQLFEKKGWKRKGEQWRWRWHDEIEVAIHQIKGIMGRQWVIVRTSRFQTENWPVSGPSREGCEPFKMERGNRKGKGTGWKQTRRKGRLELTVLDCFLQAVPGRLKRKHHLESIHPSVWKAPFGTFRSPFSIRFYDRAKRNRIKKQTHIVSLYLISSHFWSF